MKKNQINLIDDNGIEITAQYTSEHVDSQIEEGHGYHEVGNYDHIELISVMVYIAKQGIDITDRLNEKQIAKIEKLIIQSI